MTNISEKKWTGVWWICSDENSEDNRVPGILSVSADGHYDLSLTPLPKQNSLVCKFRERYTIWGIDENEKPITLFEAIGQQLYITGDLDRVKSIRASIVLVGAHVRSLEDPWVSAASIHFPYLHSLYFENLLDYKVPVDSSTISIDIDGGKHIHSIHIDRRTNWELHSQYSLHLMNQSKEVRIMQDTYFYINNRRRVSIIGIDKIIREFTDFLSFALLKEQNPNEIVLFNEDFPHDKYFLYYKFRQSLNPYDTILSRNISLEKLDCIMINWHKQYDRLRQVYISFERAGNRRDGIGGVPEFLHAEFALEGYYKRFHQSLRDNVSPDSIVYCENILKELLRYYSSIDIVKQMNLNIKRIKESRNAYVHLYNVTKQIYSEPHDLWIVTEKLRILAICCLLHQLGLTFDEINERIKEANVLLPEAYLNGSWF